MPSITREDGVRFIIPSYRDILSVKKMSLLKKEIILLSSTYGDYITLQKKSISQYEVAFATEPGYLLGECVWQHFRRPFDMIYCEAIPNTTEAILVVVKSGSVYLDGSFPIETIADELVVFKTQSNSFEIYVNGDVPLSENPAPGKFSFDSRSVRSFNIIDEPVFPTLDGVKAFQLQLIDTVLKAHGIGVLPLKQISAVLIIAVLLWMAYDYLTTHKTVIILPTVVATAVNPYQGFVNDLATPEPSSEVTRVVETISLLFTLPGWTADSIDYSPGLPGIIVVKVKSNGARTGALAKWASLNSAKLVITPTGATITLYSFIPRRSNPGSITRIEDVITGLIDRMSYIVHGNVLNMGGFVDHKVYAEQEMTVTFADVSPMLMLSIGQQLKELPLVITKISATLNGGQISGTITFKVIGN